MLMTNFYLYYNGMDVLSNKNRFIFINHPFLGHWCLTPFSTIFHYIADAILLVEQTVIPAKIHKPIEQVIDKLVYIT